MSHLDDWDAETRGFGTVVTSRSVGWSENQVVFRDDEQLPVCLNDEQQPEVVAAWRARPFERDGRLFSIERWRIKRADLNQWVNSQPHDGDGGRDGD